jgi:hypothetical protein
LVETLGSTTAEIFRIGAQSDLTEQQQDPDRLAWKAVQERIRSELFPARKLVRYESEEQLYQMVRDTFETFWDPPDDRYLDVSSSCAIFSQRIHQFNTTPYLFFHGPPDSGKSRALDLLRLLCRNALKSSSISPAAIYQFLTETHGTLLVDETDKWGVKSRQGPSERTLELLQILNSGYRRGDYAIRANRDGGKPVFYHTFGFKAGAGTEQWPRTLLERCIVLEMNENIRSIPAEINAHAIEPLQGMLEMYHVIYDLGRAAEGNPQPREIDLEIDELRDMVGDNRVAELYYGPYVCCPTTRGRQALLELAKEDVTARGEARADSDVGQVLESILSVWLLHEMPDFLTVEDLVTWHSDYPTAIKDRPSWIGHKLSKLGFTSKQRRLPQQGPSRGIPVSPEKLARLDRQFRLYYLYPRPAESGTSGTSGTTPGGEQS